MKLMQQTIFVTVTPLFNNVPTHVTVDFACVLRAGSTVTCVRRQSQLDTIVQLQYLFQHYKCSYIWDETLCTDKFC